MMDAIPYAEKKTTTYENFIAWCPHCGRKNVYNRASDLQEFEPIDFKTVACLHNECSKPFNINGDHINPAHEALLFDCYEHMQSKSYMHTILTLAQAYEVFFGAYARAELLWKPFALENRDDLERVNFLAKELFAKIQRWTFVPMRCFVLWHLATYDEPHKTLDQSESVIQNLVRPSEPEDADLRFKEQKLRQLLLRLKGTNINDLRNEVVHKQAYRPTRQQAEAALDEARNILFPLSHLLNIHDDLSLYVGSRRGRGISRTKE